MDSEVQELTESFDGWNDETPPIITLSDLLNIKDNHQRASEFYLQAGLIEVIRFEDELIKTLERIQLLADNTLADETQQIALLHIGMRDDIKQALKTQEQLFIQYERKAATITEQVQRQVEDVVSNKLQQVIMKSLDDAHRRAAMIPIKPTTNMWVSIVALTVVIGSIVGFCSAYLTSVIH